MVVCRGVSLLLLDRNDFFLLDWWLDLRWWDNPEAAVTVVLAFVGAAVGLYRFRAIPIERKRETFEGMRKDFGRSREARGAVLGNYPPLVLLGAERVRDKALAGPTRTQRFDADLELLGLRKGLAQLDVGIFATSAHDYYVNELKFRSLLWSVLVLRGQVQDEEDLTAMADARAADAVELVNLLSDFAQFVEAGIYPQSDVLAQFHRGILPVARVLEPLIWERSLDGRWGRRILRLGLQAEHFNDSKRIHSTRAVPLTTRWSGGPQRLIIHPARHIDRYGHGRVRASDYAKAYGATHRLVSSVWAWWADKRGRYGGWRLRRHVRYENRLAGRIKFALETLDMADDHRSANGYTRFDPLDLSWTLRDLGREVEWASRDETALQRTLAAFASTRRRKRLETV